MTGKLAAWIAFCLVTVAVSAAVIIFRVCSPELEFYSQVDASFPLVVASGTYYSSESGSGQMEDEIGYAIDHDYRTKGLVNRFSNGHVIVSSQVLEKTE